MKKIIIYIVIFGSVLLTGCSSKEASVADSNKALYQSALSCIEEKQYPQAIGILSSLGAYKDSEELTQQLRYIINGSYIAAGWPCIGAVTSDGGVIQINAYEDALSTEGWKQVYHLSSGGMYLDGISSEGTVITTDPHPPEMLYDNILHSGEAIGAGTSNMIDAAREIMSFKNVKAFISAYPAVCAVLTEDHKVETAGLDNEISKEIKTWDNIVSIAGYLPDVAGLKSDGTIVYLSSRYEGEKAGIASWTDIAAIAEGTYLFGLKTDGTVVSSGVLKECKVEDWKDIIAISASRNTTVGLKSDGTVVAVGDNYYGQCNVEKWTDIAAIAANDYYTLGLTAKGTLVITANISPKDLAIPDVSNISNLYVPVIKSGGK